MALTGAAHNVPFTEISRPCRAVFAFESDDPDERDASGLRVFSTPVTFPSAARSMISLARVGPPFSEALHHRVGEPKTGALVISIFNL